MRFSYSQHQTQAFTVSDTSRTRASVVSASVGLAFRRTSQRPGATLDACQPEPADLSQYGCQGRLLRRVEVVSSALRVRVLGVRGLVFARRCRPWWNAAWAMLRMCEGCAMGVCSLYGSGGLYIGVTMRCGYRYNVVYNMCAACTELTTPLLSGSLSISDAAQSAETRGSPPPTAPTLSVQAASAQAVSQSPPSPPLPLCQYASLALQHRPSS